MNVTRSLVLLAGLVGALGTGCVARVHSHAYVAHRDVVWVEPPPLVYVDGVYVVQDSDVGVYYVDGYYWYESGGVWYHRAYYNDPWVTVHYNVVPTVVVHRDHHHYAHYHGDGHVYREPARPNKTAHHSSAKPSSHSSASAGANGKVSVGDGRRSVESNAVDRSARAEAGSREGGRRETSADSKMKSGSNSRVPESRVPESRVPESRVPESRSASVGDSKGGPSDSREPKPPSATNDRGSRAELPREAPDQPSVSKTKKKPKAKPRVKPRRSSR